MSDGSMRMKVCVIGNAGIGKTALAYRLKYKKPPPINLQETIGGVFSALEMVSAGTKVTVGVWDTAGQDRFKSVCKQYYRDAHAIIVCFSLTNKESWDCVQYWINEITQHAEASKIYLCSTKKDLVDGFVEDRKIDYRTAADFAASIGSKYKETSSMTGENVAELFQLIVDDFVEYYAQLSIAPLIPSTIVLNGASGTRPVTSGSWYCCYIV